MTLKPRHVRLLLVASALALLALAATLVLSAMRDNLMFFFTPTQVLAGEAPSQGRFRIGGMVEPGSLRRLEDGVTASFMVTDKAQRLAVRYRGPLPDLFKEGKGVVAQGRLQAGAQFVADEVLAKHDENYMPPEAAQALANSGGATGRTASPNGY